jgi:hypothetical protein
MGKWQIRNNSHFSWIDLLIRTWRIFYKILADTGSIEKYIIVTKHNTFWVSGCTTGIN